MNFDGAANKGGVGVVVWISSPSHYTNLLSFKLDFECAANDVEYEALILGLNILKDLGAKRIAVYGNSELIVNQLNGTYQTKHPKMRSYRNEVWHLFVKFLLSIKSF